MLGFTFLLSALLIHKIYGFLTHYKHNDRLPFIYTAALFLVFFTILCGTLMPYFVPYQITIWDAAGYTGSLQFMLVGVVLVLPVILFYTGYLYKVFSGKTTEDGYH
jgi:cytochrome d ubiquinol oxidase subunit II